MKITVSSNPAMGKTELTHLLAKKFNGTEFLEVADDWITPKFYEDKNRWALTMQLQKMTERINFWINSEVEDVAIIDQNLFYDMVYAKANATTGTMTEDEYQLYLNVANQYRDKMYRYRPDLDITLVGTVEHQFNNMEKRGRDFETFEEGTPEREYFELLNKLTWQYAETDYGFPRLIIDVTGMDFVNDDKDYSIIMSLIDEKLKELELI